MGYYGQESELPEDQIQDQEENDEQFNNYEIREQDRLLPLANVGRVMKNALKNQLNAKLSKESKMCMQECVSEFISFITSDSADKCRSEKRKTLNGEDILYSLNSLGFENYAEVLKIYLAKYRQLETKDAEVRREKDRARRLLRKQRLEAQLLEAQEDNSMLDFEDDNNTDISSVIDSFQSQNDEHTFPYPETEIEGYPLIDLNEGDKY